MAAQLPTSMRALVLESRSTPAIVKEIATPTVEVGSAIIQILATPVISYAGEVFNGTRKYPFPTPLIGGFSSIGRVAAVGPDATKLKQGDLVWVNCLVKSRDNPADVFLAGFYEGDTPGSAKLMREVWRDWTFAEYCRAPLENVFRLDEEALSGYTHAQLGYIGTALVSYGGLKDISLSAGETIIIAPATGQFGGAAVLVALSTGAKVIAMGRNKESLAALKAVVPFSGRLETVPITGNVDEEVAALTTAASGQADAFLDIGPPGAYQSSHIKSGILALRHSGRVSLMAGYLGDVQLPYRQIMHKNISLRGKWMYEPSEVREFIKMVEKGVLKLDLGKTESYTLEQHQQAFDAAANQTGLGQYVVLGP